MQRVVDFGSGKFIRCDPHASLVSLEDDLRELQTALNTVPAQSEPPRPFLDILDERTTEAKWNQIFTYLLDPEKPHGFRNHVLQAFLDLLESTPRLDFMYNRADIARISVDSEVSTPSGDIADLVIRAEDRWFVWIEMKVRAAEGANQTRNYVEDDHVDDLPKDVFADGYYVYLSKPGDPGATAQQFVDIGWDQVVEQLEDRLLSAPRDLPERSHVHFIDFIDTIKMELDMTPYQENLEERKKLYFTYRDAIETARDALEEYVKQELQQEWETELLEPDPPSKWDSGEWSCDNVGGGYGQIRWSAWEDFADVNIHYEHFPRSHHFADGQLVFALHVERDTDKRAAVKQHLEDVMEIEEEGRTQYIVDADADGDCRFVFDPGSRASDTPHPRSVTRTIYKYEPGDSEGYYEALEKAFNDHYPLAERVLNTPEPIRT
jgi:hypothetical protein